MLSECSIIHENMLKLNHYQNHSKLDFRFSKQLNIK